MPVLKTRKRNEPYSEDEDVKALNDEGDPVDIEANNVDIVRQGTKIILPPKMEWDEAIEWLKRKKREDEELVGIYHVIDCYPLDGAYAFKRAIEQIYGWSSSIATMVSMTVSHDKTIQVPWGKVKIPGIEGELSTEMDVKPNQPPKFIISGTCKAKHRPAILRLYEKTLEILKESSVYRGKAIKIDFEYIREGRRFAPLNDEPKFWDVSDVHPEELVFESTTERIIKMTLFDLIQNTQLMRQHRVPLKRGILLAGRYGTGKTLTAAVTAKLATDNGWTFIYLKDVRDLALGLRFAALYGPAVIFAEDIDRVVTGQRSPEIDVILNTMDGVDTKGAEIITVLTTNHLESVNRAILRAGRLDAIVDVKVPDQGAAERLIRIYGRGLLTADFDYGSTSEALKGNIPATIRECVERAKVSAIAREKGDITGKVQASDVLTAADAMKMQLDLIQEIPVDKRPAPIQMGDALGTAMGSSLRESFDKMISTVSGHTNGKA